MSDTVWPQFFHNYYSDDTYPYRYFTVSPVSGSYADNADITIQYTMQYYSSWSGGTIEAINFVELYFYDSAGEFLYYENASAYAESIISGGSGSTTIHLAKCQSSYKKTAAYIEVLIETQFVVTVNGNRNTTEVPVANSESVAPKFALTHYTACGEPTSPAVSATLSRGAVTLSWGAGSAGTNNSVTGYDVQRRLSSDGSSWGSWEDVPESPVTGTSLSVSPPSTVGSYYQYQVRTRGSAGSGYYSGWVTSDNTKLRRKWDAFGAWTDEALTAGVSSIRAVHLTQLQERIAVIRAFYGLSAYAFTAVTARQTKIAKWAALIGELRSAIDGITTNHAAWNTLEAGKPRIAHITQLRDIIDNM